MVDKPNGLIETFLDKLIKTTAAFVNAISEKTKGRSIIVKLGALVIAAVLIASGIWIYYNTEREIIVVTDISGTILTKSYTTKERTVEDFLAEQDIGYEENVDVIDFSEEDKLSDGYTISITKAIKVKIVHDGTSDELVKLPPFTVQDALDEMGISLGEIDRINMELSGEPVNHDEIVIQRVTVEKEVVKKKIDYETVSVKDYSMQIGTKSSTEGKAGLKEKIYEVTYVDGEKESRKLVETNIVREPQDAVTRYGYKITSGKPSSYSEKIEGVRVTSYYCKGTPRGSYGTLCHYGTCAVDPSLIPLGSLIYVEGYGYAIANDTGSAVKGKVVDVYMESLGQCVIWGARRCTVYVIG